MGKLRILSAGILIGLLIGLVLLFGVDLIALVQLALEGSAHRHDLGAATSTGAMRCSE